MTTRYLGVVVAAASKDEVARAYASAATGEQVSMLTDGKHAFCSNSSSLSYGPFGGSLRSMEQDVDIQFCSKSGTAQAHLTVCLDGCQHFIMSDASDLQQCPSCSASLADVTEDRILDVVFGEPCDSLSTDPVFCGTDEQATAYVAAMRSGTQASVSSDIKEHGFDPYTGEQARTANATAAEFGVGQFYRFRCAAECSNPVTLSASSDVVFCACCSAPLIEEETRMKVAKIQGKVIAFNPSLSSAVSELRQIIVGGAKACMTSAGDSESFVSTSGVRFDPFVGERVTARKWDSVSCDVDSSSFDKLHVHTTKCSDGCGFLLSTSGDAVFCPACSAPLIEPDASDLAGIDSISSDATDVSDDMESDLAELDDDGEELDFEDEDESESSECSKSGDDEDLEDDLDEEDDLDLEEEDGDDSLSADDYEYEDGEEDDFDEEDDFEDDEEDDFEDDEDDEEDDFEDDEDASESSDDEDEDDAFIEDDELGEMDFEDDEEGDDSIDEAIESQSGDSPKSVLSITALSAIKSVSGDLKTESLSMVYDGNSKWFAFYEGKPIASLNFTSMSNAMGDEEKAKRLFNSPSLSAAVAAVAGEKGVESALKEFGFDSVSFDVNVADVIRAEAEANANERVAQINAEIDSISSDRIERYEAAVNTAFLGQACNFWGNNNLTGSLVNKMVAAGLSVSTAREMVESTFIAQSPEFVAQLFERGKHLASLSTASQNEIAHAIESRVAAAAKTGDSVEASLSSMMKPAGKETREQPKAIPEEAITSTSGELDTFQARCSVLI